MHTSDQATIIGGAVGATVAVLILSSAVVGASILVVLKKCKKKKVAMEADLQELTEKQSTYVYWHGLNRKVHM